MEQVFPNVFEFSLLEARFKIYYLLNQNDTINLASLQAQIKEIYNNVNKYMGNPFKGLIFEFWHQARQDIPKNVYENGIFRQYGIGNTAGLTWSNLKLIQINNNSCGTDKALADVISHEIGHWLDYFTDPDLNDDLQLIWNTIRGKDSTPATAPNELMAEDFRLFFGATGTKNVERTDKYNCINGNHVQGLKDFYLIWKKTKEYFLTLEANNITRSTIALEYSKTDFDYIALNFTIKKNNYIIPIKIDREGVKQKVNILFFSFYLNILAF